MYVKGRTLGVRRWVSISICSSQGYGLNDVWMMDLTELRIVLQNR